MGFVRKVLLIGAIALVSMPAHPCLSAPSQQTLRIPEVTEPIVIDGKLNEPCYRKHPPLTAFVAASESGAAVQATKAWIFWSPDRLNFAFEVTDSTPVGAPPSKNERDVDGQDRVEVFIWSGKPAEPYYCIEVASRGAIHDYKARFYRKFDDSWSPAGWKCKVAATPTGYVVEASLSRAAMEAMGQKLKVGQTFRLGLFRADFPKLKGEPTWITWVDRRGEPDFHVAESFGRAVLSKARP
ncbi:MAG: carbohydrate-binding family 9-like protein [Fimbriimonadales bacterium]